MPFLHSCRTHFCIINIYVNRIYNLCFQQGLDRHPHHILSTATAILACDKAVGIASTLHHLQATRLHGKKTHTHFILTLPLHTPILSLLSKRTILFKIHPQYSTELYTLVTHLSPTDSITGARFPTCCCINFKLPDYTAATR